MSLATMITRSFATSLFDDSYGLKMEEGSDFYGFKGLDLQKSFDEEKSSRSLVDINLLRNQVQAQQMQS